MKYSEFFAQIRSRTKDVADGREATRAECQAIYRAVRAGAGAAWKRHRRNDDRETT